ncbi:outer membrane lipoprotein chaperone LolA [Thiomicrorhabdus sp. ZW0627]|uniref:outer membrane lipoprotein chaperone LolA n=1 Tax=Thiomicrorhabdus sp. ZW0627 TaxID=3039774 RepID=UPI0024365C14|nr:outer membrane lipoprotein chaperone LolA [Thiomicrorhabdus sp. ZW0627]MDG6773308.1 outer membrane lipoprotein chaperone LolA [Thiomicrorhabdus sp. ZW0627]
MKFSNPFTWLAVLVFSISMPTYAQSELQDYVNQLKTFSADFEQVQPDEERFTLNASSGNFKLERPGKLVWNYIKPEPQKIVADGVNLWVQDDDLEQVSVRPIEDIKSEIPLSWLLYDEPIENRFKIIEEGSRHGSMRFNLTPKEATYFQSIEIVLRDGQMTEVWMYQSADNVTRVRFKNIHMNEAVPASEFNYHPPQGYDLVGQPQ